MLLSMHLHATCSRGAKATPALRVLLLGDVDALVPLAQLPELRSTLLGHLGSLGLMPQALALQDLLQLQGFRLRGALHYVLERRRGLAPKVLAPERSAHEWDERSIPALDSDQDTSSCIALRCMTDQR